MALLHFHTCPECKNRHSCREEAHAGILYKICLNCIKNKQSTLDKGRQEEELKLQLQRFEERSRAREVSQLNNELSIKSQIIPSSDIELAQYIRANGLGMDVSGILLPNYDENNKEIISAKKELELWRRK